MTALSAHVNDNLLIQGPMTAIRKHVARVLLDLAASGLTYQTMDAYRLIEIFLEKDTEFETTSQAIDNDLLILLLGFADPPNRYLPELVMQAVARRDLIQKPTWVVLGLPTERIAGKYSQALADKLAEFKKVNAK